MLCMHTKMIHMYTTDTGVAIKTMRSLPVDNKPSVTRRPRFKSCLGLQYGSSRVRNDLLLAHNKAGHWVVYDCLRYQTE